MFKDKRPYNHNHDKEQAGNTNRFGGILKKLVKPILLSIPVVLAIIAVIVWVFVLRPASSAKTATNSSIEVLTKDGCSKESIAVLESNYSKLTDEAVKATSASTIAQCSSSDISNINTTLEWSKKAGESYRKTGDTTKADRYKAYTDQMDQVIKASSSYSTDPTVEKGTEQ